VEPWFDPNIYGPVLGVTTGGAGAVTSRFAGKLALRGERRGLVLGALSLQLVVAVFLLILGLAAVSLGQPTGVAFALALPGIINIVVLGVVTRKTSRKYQQSGQRAMAAGSEA
jgi:hypothetical protein